MLKLFGSVGDFLVYLKAYARTFFRSAPWVTAICGLLFVVLLFVPQASELILSQATYPPTTREAAYFWLRMGALTLASLVLAFSVWLSARVLVSAEWASQPGGFSRAVETYMASASSLPQAQQAEIQAALYAPRQLGLSGFFILQLAAARSISEQGYTVPVALVAVWIVVLALGLMRLAHIKGEDLRPWWIGLLLAAGVYAVGAIFNDLAWVDSRAPNEAWQAEQYRAIHIMGWSAVGLCAALLAVTPWVTAATRGSPRQLLASLLTVGAVIGSFYAAGELGAGDMYGLFFALQSLAACVYWAAVVHRRSAAEKLQGSMAASASPAAAGLAGLVQRRMSWVVGSGVLGFTVVLIAWATLDPIGMGAGLGAVSIVLLFFSFLVLAVALVQAGLDRISIGKALPGGLIAMGLIFLLFLVPTPPQTPPGEAEGMGATPAPAPLEEALAQLAQGQEPIFAVAAHGGGIRAALYTASFAAWLDHYTTGQFSQRLLAGSGASGGSVGLAVWASARAAGCDSRPPVVIADSSIPACVQAVNEALAQDHLAPLIATGLFRDYIFFFADPQRGNTLQASILGAVSQLSGKLQDGAGRHLAGALAHSRFPLILNTSHVGTAIPFAMVTREGMLPLQAPRPDTYLTYVPSSASNSVSLLTAAMHSARFPLISPKGMVAARGGPAVVDGGYFDNSGVAVLRQHILALQSHYGVDLQEWRKRLVVISLDNEPIAASRPPEAGDGRNSFDEILGTILAARGAHGYAAWHQLCTELDKYNMFSVRPGAPLQGGCRWPSELDGDDGPQLWQRQLQAQGPALGWYLSPRSARRVTEDARQKAYAIAMQFNYTQGLEPPRGASMLRMPAP